MTTFSHNADGFWTTTAALGGRVGRGQSRSEPRALAFALQDIADQLIAESRLKVLGRADIWDMALFDEVKLEGRKVFSRPCLVPDPSARKQYLELPAAERGAFVLEGVLDDSLSEEDFNREVADAESK